jgi:tRNA(Leu) C34 or U34 (ribose-2'-O)-methylase TrmL
MAGGSLPMQPRPRKDPPGVVLVNPKFAVNVGNTIRACAAFGIYSLVWDGDRVTMEGHKRLPREERMKGYDKVDFMRYHKPVDVFGREAVPVCVEILPQCQNLAYFEHPENAVYIFGPEDGSVPKGYRHLCHHFVTIPAEHCLNLAMSVTAILLHRRLQRAERGLQPLPELAEERGFIV